MSRLRHLAEQLLSRVIIAEQEAIPMDGITPTHTAMLTAVIKVGRRGGISAIARLTGLSQSTVTWNVQRLEEMGLVHRIIKDGSRIHSIVATQEGAAVLSHFRAVDAYVESAVLSGLGSDEERVELIASLERAILDEVEPHARVAPAERAPTADAQENRK